MSKPSLLFVIVSLVVLMFYVAFEIYLLMVNDVKENTDINAVNNTQEESINSEINSYIDKIDNVILCIYEKDITGRYLTLEQKEYITKMYINYYKGTYIGDIVSNNLGEEYISLDAYKKAYEVVFNPVDIEKEIYSDNVLLPTFNIGKVYLDNYKILSYNLTDNLHTVEVEYTSNLGNYNFNFKVSYYIVEYDKNKFNLEGFIIEGEN